RAHELERPLRRRAARPAHAEPARLAHERLRAQPGRRAALDAGAHRQRSAPGRDPLSPDLPARRLSTLGRLVALPIACLAGGLVACAPPPPPDPPRIAAIELTPTLADHVLVLGTLHAAEPGLDVFGVSLERASPPARGFVAADG